jgi:hypothetical protein
VTHNHTRRHQTTHEDISFIFVVIGGARRGR